MRHFIVYKTTNLVNNMIYIGKHETENLNDHYIGSGRKLLEDIKKYGKVNFKCEILYEFDNREDMNNKEAEIVNQEFLNRDDVYNINIGGTGWKCMVNTPDINKKRLDTMMKKVDYYKKCSQEGQQKLRQLRNNKEYITKLSSKIKDGLKKYYELHPGSENTFLGKKHTEETKRKMSLSRKGKQFNNKAIGTMWICNDELKCNDRIYKDEPIPNGWIKGRKMSYRMYIH